MKTPTIGFWFEFGSTYSYLSAARVEGEAATEGVSAVCWEQFLLGLIFKEIGWNDSLFNVYPTKERYMWRDVERSCAKYGLPFARPSRFPRNSLLAARVACLAKARRSSRLPEFTRTVFRANFAEDREFGDAAEIRSILDSLGEPGESLVEEARTPESKALLREQLRRARELGIFGAPRFVVGDEHFWETTVWRTPWRGRPVGRLEHGGERCCPLS